MKRNDLIKALRRLKVETGSLACMGCGHEHSCGVHGCAIINEAIAQLQHQKETTIDDTKKAIDELEQELESGDE